MEITPDHRLRLVPLGHAHRLDPVLGPGPGVVADEVHEVGTEQEQLRHDGVVVVVLGDMTIGAGLGLGLALGVREMGREGLGAETAGRDRRLLDINELAVDVARGQDERRGGAHRGDTPALDRTMFPELIHVVACHLRVVGRVVARLVVVVMLAPGLPVGLDRQMTAAAARRPGAMAGEAGHVLVLVGAVRGFHTRAPGHGRPLGDRLGTGSLRVVIGMHRIERVLDERESPFLGRVERRALIQAPLAPLEARPAVLVADEAQIVPALGRRGTAGAQVGVLIRRAVTVLAIDLDGLGDLAVEVPVAVRVLREMAIHAVHADIDVHGGQVHRLLKLRGVLIGDPLTVLVEEMTAAIALVDRAEIPAMAVVIGELGVLHLGVSVPDRLQEIDIAPKAAHGRLLGVAHGDLPGLLVPDDLLGIDAGEEPGVPTAHIELVLGPHIGRIRLVVPHRVAQIAIHEHIGLVHVADHALAGRDGARELVFQGMAALALGDGLVHGHRGAVMALARIGSGMARIAVVAVDHMARGTARGAVIARLVVGPHEPGQGVVQARLMEVDDRHRDARAGAGAAVRLAGIGPSRLLQALQLAERIGHAGLREQVADIASAALEDAEHIRRREHLPHRQRRELGQHTARRHDGGHVRRGLHDGPERHGIAA